MAFFTDGDLALVPAVPALCDSFWCCCSCVFCFQVLCIWKEAWRRRGSSLVDCSSTARYLIKLYSSAQAGGLETKRVLPFRSAGHITGASPPIWPRSFLQTHTLHVLAKHHTLHDADISQLIAYCPYTDVHDDKSINLGKQRKPGCRHSLAFIFSRMNWRCGTSCCCCCQS